MEYLIDQQDIEFLFKDVLDIENLKACPPYQDYGADDYLMIANEALKFAKNEMAPLNQKGDQTGAKLVNGKVILPEGFPELFKAYGQNGFFAVDIDPQWGGQGLPVVINSLLMEYFIGANCSFALLSLLTKGASNLVATFGTEELKKQVCQKMFSGEWAGTMCLTEPQAGTAVGDLSTKAIPQNDGTFLIQGTKIFITGGDHNCADNIIHLVLARVEGDPAGSKGISLFVVPKIWINSDGSLGEPNDIQIINIEHKMGINASPTCLVTFGDNKKCRGFLVGERRQGLPQMFQLMNEARLNVGLQGLAIGSTAYEHAKKYAKERVQGGNTAIIEYPDVKRMLATQKAYVEALRAMIYTAAIFEDLSHHHPDAKIREHSGDLIDFLTPICKAYGSDRGFDICNLAVMVHGGYGYTREYPVEQYLRDVKISAIYEGTNGVQALDLLGRKLRLKNGGLFKAYYEWIQQFCEQAKSDTTVGALIPQLKKALQHLRESVEIFAQKSSENLSYAQLHAMPFLNSCGDVTSAFLLLKSAYVAGNKLKSASLAQEKTFYENKIKIAHFFVSQILPQTESRLASLKSGDESCLGLEF